MGQLFPTCVSYQYMHTNEKNPAIALPYCFSVFVLPLLLSVAGRV